MVENCKSSVGIELLALRNGRASSKGFGPAAPSPQPAGEVDLEAGYGAGNSSAADNAASSSLPHNSILRDHKDSGNRYTEVNQRNRHKDHYLRPDDGKLDILRVQQAPNYTRRSGIKTTWEEPIKLGKSKRLWMGLRNAARNILVWTYTDWLKARSIRTRADGSQDLWHPTWKTLYLKYVVACFGLTLTALFINFKETVHPGGKYPSVRYRYFRYPKVARNLIGNQKPAQQRQESAVTQAPDSASANVAGASTGQSLASTAGKSPLRRVHARKNEFDVAFGRHLRPRYLCIIHGDDQPPQASNPYNIVDVDEWDKTRSAKDSGEYVFVSYTRSQYQTYSQEDIDKWTPPNTEAERIRRLQMPRLQKGDLQQLYQVGIVAAQRAGINAFWIDALCMTPETAKLDSHRICDIARGANRLVIALKDQVTDRILERPCSSLDDLLQNWASRLWTLPEMLLAPTKYDIEIYRSSSTAATVRYRETIAKRNMSERAYMDDGLLVRQLVEHFESNLHLTQTELLTIGLECVMSRETNPYARADPIYALMTLARRRPPPEKDLSLFEAFARLSLLNDSNMLLERLICILPLKRGEPWYKIVDFWGAKLWDIFPTSQIAGIADEQTVILDGAFGATIEWGELSKVGFLKRQTIWRTIAELLIRSAPGWLIIGIMSLVSTVGIILFLIAITTVVILPYFLLTLYRGKFWSTQALFIGMEGVPDLDWLEQQLFGLSEGRLKWSPYSSTQSRHRLKITEEHLEDECEAIAPSGAPLPLADNVTERQYNRANDADESKASSTNSRNAQRHTEVDQDRTFTLVDTYTMDVTTFRAVHPPSVVMICGHEGGMRRAVLCSYNYKTQTFHRETVLHMPTKVLDRMDRVERFRFSMESLPL